MLWVDGFSFDSQRAFEFQAGDFWSKGLTTERLTRDYNSRQSFGAGLTNILFVFCIQRRDTRPSHLENDCARSSNGRKLTANAGTIRFGLVMRRVFNIPCSARRSHHQYPLIFFFSTRLDILHA